MDSILDHAPCGYVSFSDDGKIVNINTTLKQLLRYEDGTFTKSYIEELFTVSSRIFYNTHLFPLLRLHHRADEIFLSLLARDQTHIPVLVNAARKTYNDTFINECVLIPVHQRKKFEDELVKARKNAEDALKKNEVLMALSRELEFKSLELDNKVQNLLSINQNLIEFNKIISHDFHEPIRKIEIFARRMSETNDRAKIASDLERVLRSAEKLKRLTSTLYQYMNPGEDKAFNVVSLETLIMTAKEEVSKHLMFSDFDIIVENLGEVEGYERQLQMLFYHLIENSIQYRHYERRLQIIIKGVIIQENIYRSTSDRYKYVDCQKIQYIDNGNGFEEVYSEYVFGLLKKIERKSSGLGMGLAICKRIVENHFGSIAVNSKPGEGTTFHILIPIKMQSPLS